ncbi:MAG: 2Fe-2S iron-sulfur cluster binding domain-containing protein [Gallionella sp.]|jgi:ferredoxin-NADP reductase/ferredoxin|nr:2Fe-2S iron-sulfur cluster binding domain-containing protein [Gallionella sp.]
MPKIIYGGQSYECDEGSVLDCLTAHGVAVPSSCRSGVCQTCLMRVTEGEVPEKARAGLKPTLAAQNYFLACSCYPEKDIEVALPEAGLGRLEAKVARVEYLNADILGIRLKPSRTFEYKAGQFINLFKDEATARSYSLASVPALEEELFLNVRKVPGGLVSGWAFADIKAGDTLTISEASGDCFYVPGQPEQNILLIATGSGLAPLYGIIRDALLNEHHGKLSLYHGSYNADGFYLVDELRRLAQAHPNFEYVPCISDGEASVGYASGMVLDVALADNPDLSGWRVFLCGNPNMVNAAKQQTFFAGASMRDIFADPF